MNSKTFNKGFTLIELLVVIAIIGLLASIILVSLNSAREKARDTRRVADIKQIQIALELYYSKYGTLPRPHNYGENNSSPGYWDGWWDLSSGDGDGDGIYFLDFLVDAGLISASPMDPLNTPIDFNDFPFADGYRYVYFVAPKGYTYQGGSCVVNTGSAYMLAINKFESAPAGSFNSDCSCIWQNIPNFFQSSFDYITCGTF